MSTQYNDNLVNLQCPFNLVPTTEIIKDDKYIDGNVYFNQIYPQESGPYAYEKQRVATFWMDSSTSAVDLLNSTIEMDVASTGTTGLLLDGDAHSLFARVRLLTKAGVVFEDSVGYNVRHSMEKVMSVGKEFCNTHFDDAGDNMLLDESAKTVIGSASPLHLEFVPDLSFIHLCKVLHLPATGGMALELTFDDSRNCISTQSNSATISVSNLKYNLRMVPLSKEYIDKLRIASSRGELIYNFNSTYQQVAPWAQSNNALSIQYGVKSGNALLARWYLSTDATNASTKYIQKSQYLTGFTSIQLQHGAEFIPRQAIQSNTGAYKSTLQMFNLLNDGDASNLITRSNYSAVDANSTFASTPLFIVGVQLSNANMHTGISLQDSPLYLRTLNTAISNLYCQCWLYYSVAVQVMPDGGHIISQ